METKNPNQKTINHLFDHTVKPVLLYGSEIWETFIGKKLKEGKDNFISKLFSNLKQEHVHLKFCKYILVVGKRSTSLAIMGELGRYPLYMYIEIIISMFKYLKRLYTNMKIFYFAMPFQNLNTYMRMGKIAGLAVWNLLNISPNIFKLPG